MLQWLICDCPWKPVVLACDRRCKTVCCATFPVLHNSDMWKDASLFVPLPEVVTVWWVWWVWWHSRHRLDILLMRGFNVSHLKAKCSPLCPWENDGCCMARLLSKQEDFVNQVSMLEDLITKAGHSCIFLPKFHCELNPIEMVCQSILSIGFYCTNNHSVLGMGQVSV